MHEYQKEKLVVAGVRKGGVSAEKKRERELPRASRTRLTHSPSPSDAWHAGYMEHSIHGINRPYA